MTVIWGQGHWSQVSLNCHLHRHWIPECKRRHCHKGLLIIARKQFWEEQQFHDADLQGNPWVTSKLCQFLGIGLGNETKDVREKWEYIQDNKCELLLGHAPWDLRASEILVKIHFFTLLLAVLFGQITYQLWNLVSPSIKWTYSNGKDAPSSSYSQQSKQWKKPRYVQDHMWQDYQDP